jgi:hypothetical protein
VSEFVSCTPKAELPPVKWKVPGNEVVGLGSLAVGSNIELMALKRLWRGSSRPPRPTAVNLIGCMNPASRKSLPRVEMV